MQVAPFFLIISNTRWRRFNRSGLLSFSSAEAQEGPDEFYWLPLCRLNHGACLCLSLFQTRESADQIMVVVFVHHYFKHGEVQIKSWWLCLSFIISNRTKCRSNHGGYLCPSLFQTDKVQIKSRWLSLKVQVEPSWLPSSFIVSDTSSSKSDVAVSKTRWRRSNLAGCLCLSLSQTREAADRVLAVAFVFHYLQHKKVQIESRRFPSEDPPSPHPPPPPPPATRPRIIRSGRLNVQGDIHYFSAANPFTAPPLLLPDCPAGGQSEIVTQKRLETRAPGIQFTKGKDPQSHRNQINRGQG